MAEPTVQVPVSLIERAHAMIDTRRVDASEVLDALAALISQPTPSAKPSRCPSCRHVPHDGRVCLNMASDNECACTHGSATPMAPGTTFDYPTRWEVSGRGGMTGRVIVEMVEERTTRYLDELDPSTIRDVTP